MEKKFILTHDLGTSGNKTVLFDFNLNCVSETTSKYPIYYPRPGWAEQEADDYWDSVIKNTLEILETQEINSNDIKALAFTCQMNCTIPINEEGKALIRAISWLDTRAAEITKKFTKGFPKVSGYPLFKILTFLRITGGGPGHNGKDPISHILWLKEHQPSIYDETFKFLSVKDYIIYKCTGNAIISKDLAHTTWLMDSRPEKFIWSNKLLKKYRIGKSKLPEIKEFTEEAGKLNEDASEQMGLPVDLPVFVCSGDLTSSAIGSGALKLNEKSLCVGTAAWVGTHVVERKLDLGTYIGPISSFRDRYLLISKQETGAACLDWIKNQIFKDKINELTEEGNLLYEDLDRLIEKTEAGSKSLIFTPWMFGERSPINDPDVRGGFYNLSLDHEREHMLRSVYEGVAFNLKWSLGYIEKMVGPSNVLNFVGGGAKSEVWCQIIADIMGKKVNQMRDASLCGAKGAAVSAMVGLGLLRTYNDAIPFCEVKKTFSPNRGNGIIYQKLFNEYVQIYKRNKQMFLSLNL